jgi:hypothetical protein
VVQFTKCIINDGRFQFGILDQNKLTRFFRCQKDSPWFLQCIFICQISEEGGGEEEEEEEETEEEEEEEEEMSKKNEEVKIFVQGLKKRA